ncbi:copper fist DNA binding domain-containing protein [Lipomyces chichibuensis]|uniref:copper fist DNA binding domain-containing protein n=1 Tax=Lipomyces chichibuensis TaxID=1546026 RepID=UPI0033441CF2
MVFIDGVKYACDTCIRGHRVTTCTHKDRPLTMIKPKGRPVSQCPHCREARKNHALHTKCDCTDHKSGSSPGKSVTCGCPHGGKCDCSKLKNAGRTAGGGVTANAHDVALKASHIAGVRNSTTMTKPHLHGSSPYGIASTGNSPSAAAQAPPMTYTLAPVQAAPHQCSERYDSPKRQTSPLSDTNISAYTPHAVQIDPITRQIPDVAALCRLPGFRCNTTSTDQATGGRASTSSVSSLNSGSNGYDSESTYSSYSSFDDLTTVGGTSKDVLQGLPMQGDISYSQALPQTGMTNFLEDSLDTFDDFDFSGAQTLGLVDDSNVLFGSPGLYGSAPIAMISANTAVAPTTFAYVPPVASTVTSLPTAMPGAYKSAPSTSTEYDFSQLPTRQQSMVSATEY